MIVKLPFLHIRSSNLGISLGCLIGHLLGEGFKECRDPGGSSRIYRRDY